MKVKLFTKVKPRREFNLHYDEENVKTMKKITVDIRDIGIIIAIRKRELDGDVLYYVSFDGKGGDWFIPVNFTIVEAHE